MRKKFNLFLCIMFALTSLFYAFGLMAPTKFNVISYSALLSLCWLDKYFSGTISDSNE